MKASELVKRLQELIEEHGDHEVWSAPSHEESPVNTVNRDEDWWNYMEKRTVSSFLLSDM